MCLSLADALNTERRKSIDRLEEMEACLFSSLSLYAERVTGKRGAGLEFGEVIGVR